MNETTADVNRRTQEALNTERIEPNRCPYRIYDRIDRPYLMKLDLFWCNAVNLTLRDRKLRENRRGDPLRISVESAFANHRKNLGSFTMKMGVAMLVRVLVRVIRIMAMLLFPLHEYIELHR